MIGLLCANASLGAGIAAGREDIVLLAGRGAGICARLRASGQPATCIEDAFVSELGKDADLASLPAKLLMSGSAVMTHSHVVRAVRRYDVTRVIPFKASVKLERRAAAMDIALLACEPTLVRQLENKLSLPQLAEEAQVRVPASERVVLDDALVASADVTRPLVFQPAVGFAGAGTMPVTSRADLVALVELRRGHVGKLVEFVEGVPLAIAACVRADGSAAIGSCVAQITGVPALSGNPFGSCGNDVAAAADVFSAHPRGAAAVTHVTQQVAAVLHKHGFRGIFGLDVVLSGDDAWLIEINPRITASLALTLQLQLLAAPHARTLLDEHIDAFTHAAAATTFARIQPTATDDRTILDFARRTAAASSLIVYNRGATRLTPRGLAPGRYRFDIASATLSPLGDELAIAQLAPAATTEDRAIECLILPASSLLTVSPGAEMCRIYIRGRALDPTDSRGRTLLPAISSLVDAVRNATHAVQNAATPQ